MESESFKKQLAVYESHLFKRETNDKNGKESFWISLYLFKASVAILKCEIIINKSLEDQ